MQQQVSKLTDALHLLGSLLTYPIFLTHCSPLPPYQFLLAAQKNCWKLEQLTLKRGEGGGWGGGGEWERLEVLDPVGIES